MEEQPTDRIIDYDYDAADRLIEEHISDPALGNRTTTYSYPSASLRTGLPIGNRLTKDENGVVIEYTCDDHDRLLTENGLSYTYDNNGNMLTKRGNGETWQLEYNALNQLVHAEISTPQGSSTIDYAYDHDGIRIEKTIMTRWQTEGIAKMWWNNRSDHPVMRKQTISRHEYDAQYDPDFQSGSEHRFQNRWFLEMLLSSLMQNLGKMVASR